MNSLCKIIIGTTILSSISTLTVHNVIGFLRYKEYQSKSSKYTKENNRIFYSDIGTLIEFEIDLDGLEKERGSYDLRID